jgi:PadR family transcriptional regulator PadR
MRVERELMRGAGPVAVLKLLDARGEMYGYELVEALSRQSDGVLAMGQSTLYPLLYNLQAKGLVKAQWRAAGTSAAARDRKYYTLTDRGRTRLAAETRQWNALAKAMLGLGVIDQAAFAPLTAGHGRRAVSA